MFNNSYLFRDFGEGGERAVLRVVVGVLGRVAGGVQLGVPRGSLGPSLLRLHFRAGVRKHLQRLRES